MTENKCRKVKKSSQGKCRKFLANSGTFAMRTFAMYNLEWHFGNLVCKINDHFFANVAKF